MRRFSPAVCFLVVKIPARLTAAVLFEEIPELNVQERGLLKRYATYKGLDLSSEDLRFSLILSGYPEQVLFAVDSISDLGLYAVRKDSHLIREYADDKAKVIVESFSNDQKNSNFFTSFLSLNL
ncbi:hypothetical protein J4733_16195 [Klebsiella pneumoniae]|uniref:Uncharacterized protein n=1 Tax=Klebsiella pneumoniae TaxID=573 RepID=A0A939NMQ1_KLEPN|nr:hypothetical protein [Klebsiella pneumoniae]